ncbi:MAG: adenylate/guanylate cyclase domain-containing protein [Verrucomicrobiota bacterium]
MAVQKSKVLIIEDDPVSQSVLHDLITSHGYEAVLASDGLEGWEKINADADLRLAFIDWIMPGMDGVSLCSKIKSEIKDRYVYAIMISAKTSKADLVKALELGADDFLTKPVHERELLSRLHAGERVLRYDSLLHAQMSRTDHLMEVLLPVSIANRLKNGETFIADTFPNASILFVDIVSFSTWCHTNDARAMIEQLNGVFAIFDEEMRANNVEKIKSIGDAYLVASGLPEPCQDHAVRLVRCALAILERLKRLNRHRLRPWEIRVGIASGPVVAGVIGNHRFVYDVWGDTVNRAARLEQAAMPNQVLMDDETVQHLQGQFRFQNLGIRALKGVGDQNLWELLGEIDVPSSASDSSPFQVAPTSTEAHGATIETVHPSQTAPIPSQLQAQLPEYELLELQEQDGIAVVYKAHQRSKDRLVSIKLLPADVASRQEAAFVQRFQEEARTMANHPHPGIATVFESGITTDGLLYFVTEAVDGVPLTSLIHSGQPLDPQIARHIALRVSESLIHSHRYGIVHGELTPAKIHITRHGGVKLTDLGFAKMKRFSAQSRAVRSIFTPPEAHSVDTLPGHLADIYALGVILYQMLTSELPEGNFKLPSEKSQVDPRYDNVITKTMEADPSKRYTSAEAFHRALINIDFHFSARSNGLLSPRADETTKALANLTQKIISEAPSST